MAGAFSSAFSNAFDVGAGGATSAGGQTITYSAPAVTLIVLVLAGGNTIPYSAPQTSSGTQVDVSAGGNVITYSGPSASIRTQQYVDAGGNRIHYLAPSVAVDLSESAGAATRDNPDVWVHVLIGSGSPSIEYRWSSRPLADPYAYYGGFKEPRIVKGSWGDINRNASSIDGSYAVDTWSFELDDTDGAIRALLADDDTKVELDWEITAYLVSEAGRKSSTTPRKLFRGRALVAIPVAGRKVRVECKDLLGADLKGFDLDTEVPLGTWGDDWTAEDVPEDVKKAAQTHVVGECSDFGAVDEDGAAADKGLIPVKYLGEKLISAGFPGTPPGEPAFLTPPANLRLTVFNTVGRATHTVRAAVTGLSVFGETTISNIVTVTNYPKLTFDDRDGTDPSVLWEWDASQPSGECVGYNIYVIDDSTTALPRFRMDGNRNPAGNSQTHYRDDGDDHHDKRLYPPPPTTNKAKVAEGTPGTPGSGPMFWHRFGVCRGYIPLHEPEVGIYASDVAPSATPTRVLAEAGVRGVDFILPGDAGWPESDHWAVQNGRRYAVFYGRGPRADHHVDGRVAIALNACGYTAQSNGDGLLIDQAFFAGQHILEEFFGLAADGATYQNEADWLGLPYFTNGTVPKIDSLAFARAQADSIQRLGTVKGYLARFVLDEKMTLRDWLRHFALTFNCFWRVNRHGQLGPRLLNHGQHPASGRLYRDRIEIKQWHTPEIDHRVCNHIRHVYDWDAEARQFRLPEEVIASQALIMRYGGKVIERAELLEQRFTGDAATARNAALHWFDLWNKKRRWVQFDLRYQGHEEDLLDELRFTHYDGDGLTGDHETPGVDFGHRTKLNDDTITLTVFDTSKLSPQAESEPETEAA